MDIVEQRLRNQRLVGSNLRAPVEIVSWLGAVQSQDYAAAKWAVGLRLADGAATEATIEDALTSGTILRTHALRSVLRRDSGYAALPRAA